MPLLRTPGVLALVTKEGEEAANRSDSLSSVGHKSVIKASALRARIIFARKVKEYEALREDIAALEREL